jgi:hypothetical protein
MANDQTIRTDCLSGLELAKYVVGRLTIDQSSTEKIAEDFDNDKNFISGVVDFLKDIGWVIQDRNGLYQVTRKGQTSTIIRVRPTIDFSVPHNRG